MKTRLKRLVKKARALITPAPRDVRPMFEQMMREVGVALGPFGFRTQGTDCVMETAESWAVIHFQKDRTSPNTQQKFAVDLGIASKRILRFDNFETDRAPNEYECCWRRRLGHVLQRPTELAWTIADHWSFRTAVDEVTDLLVKEALPVLQPLMEDRALTRLPGHKWGAFLSEFGSLRYKAILLAEIGPPQELAVVVEKMRKVSRYGVTETECEETVRRLRAEFPQSFA